MHTFTAFTQLWCTHGSALNSFRDFQNPKHTFLYKCERQTNTGENEGWHFPTAKCIFDQTWKIWWKVEGNSVQRIYLQQRSSDGSVNKTMLKPRLALGACCQYVYVGFTACKIPHSSKARLQPSQGCKAYMISEKAIRFWHPDYDLDRAQKLISPYMSRHLSTRNISSKSMHAFSSNLANRQTDRPTDRQTNTGKNMYLLLHQR